VANVAQGKLAGYLLLHKLNSFFKKSLL